MTAATDDYVVEQGTTFTRSYTYKDSNGTAIDLTGYSARMKARASLKSTTEIFSLTDGSGIALGGVAGTVVVQLTEAQTAAIVSKSLVYDLELINASSAVQRLVEGTITMSKEVTR